MMKWIKKISPLLLILVVLTGCQPKVESKDQYRNEFFEYFDTVTIVIGYTDSQEQFNTYFDEIKSEFKTYHELYDIYNNYDGVNNVKTINDQAGIAPVKVDDKIIDMILFSKEWYEKTNGKANIAMGSVLNLWHETRDAGKDDPDNAALPLIEDLEEANKHTNLDDVIINMEEKTVFLKDPDMLLDVGAVAKGYATEMITDYMKEEGFESFIISAGGNVKSIGKPLDGVREKWGVGIQNPDTSFFVNMDSLDTVFGNDISVVTS
ncbi:MAG: FAD:protein FMN transferase, partial [Clostridium sp.]|nr:FAD:protein FMN transferase [Clostridium sp.]